MHFTKVSLAIFCLVGYASALGNGGGYSNIVGVHGLAGDIGAGHEGYDMSHNFIPRPYKLQDQSRLDDGGVLFRTEVGDGSGSVTGSYGYRDHQGLYRQVDYVADAAGFRANVKTNEPGTDGKENPADVNMQVQQTPAGVVHRAEAEAARRAASRHHNGIGGGHTSIFGSSAHGGIRGLAGMGGAFSAFGPSAYSQPKSAY